MKCPKDIARVLSPVAVIVSLALVIAACTGTSVTVKGTIVEHDGEPAADKEVILILLLPGDKIRVARIYGGIREREVALSDWNLDILAGDNIMFATDRGGRARWKTKTNSNGDFAIAGVEPGRYVLFKMVAGTVFITGGEDGFIRVEAVEGQTNDLGTITLLHPSESITEREAQRHGE